MILFFRKYQLLFKVLTVTIVLPVGYAALIFGAWLYGRLAESPSDSGVSQADAAYYAAMVEAAREEAEQKRLEAAMIPPAMKLAKSFNCTACHKEDTKLIGPGFAQIAERYADDRESARSDLIAKVRAGGKGNWGEIPMPPHPQYAEEDLGEIVDYILSLGTENASDPSS